MNATKIEVAGQGLGLPVVRGESGLEAFRLERAREELRAHLSAPRTDRGLRIDLVTHRAGLGKSTAALMSLRDTAASALYVVESYKVAAEVVAKGREFGLDVQAPISMKDGCAQNDVVQTFLEAGLTKEHACRTCPLFPGDQREQCPQRASWKKALAAHVPVVPRAVLQNSDTLKDLAKGRDRIIVDENALDAVRIPLRVTFQDTVRFEATLKVIETRGMVRPRVLRVYWEALRKLQTVVSERVAPAPERLRALASGESMPAPHETKIARNPYDREFSREILNRRSLQEMQEALDELGVEFAEQLRAGSVKSWQAPKNLLRQIAGLAKLPKLPTPEQVGTRILVANDGAILFFAPRPFPKDAHVLLLDATAPSHLIRTYVPETAAFNVVGHQTVGAASPVTVVRGRDIYSRQYFRHATKAKSRIREQAEQLAQVIRRHGARRVGLISFKELMVDEDGDAGPLLKKLQTLVPDREFTSSWFGNLRGLNHHGSDELLLVVGTPSPNPEVLRARALFYGASEQDLHARPDYHRVTEKTRRFGYIPDAMRRAHQELMLAEIEQAVGRVARGLQQVRSFVFADLEVPQDRPGWETVEMSALALTDTKTAQATDLLLAGLGMNEIALRLQIRRSHRTKREAPLAFALWAGYRLDPGVAPVGLHGDSLDSPKSFAEDEKGEAGGYPFGGVGPVVTGESGQGPEGANAEPPITPATIPSEPESNEEDAPRSDTKPQERSESPNGPKAQGQVGALSYLTGTRLEGIQESGQAGPSAPIARTPGTVNVRGASVPSFLPAESLGSKMSPRVALRPVPDWSTKPASVTVWAGGTRDEDLLRLYEFLTTPDPLDRERRPKRPRGDVLGLEVAVEDGGLEESG